MDNTTDLETKYHRLAAEYSKVRSQAVVLKKAVYDEQAKNAEYKEVVKEQGQKIRKHSQEMESLTFRNEQLTKRIAALQQEFQVNNYGKKNKNRQSDTSVNIDLSVLDEELHKKIIENAQLISSMADKDFELTNYKDKIEWLEEKIAQLQKELSSLETRHQGDVEVLKRKLSTVTFDRTHSDHMILSKTAEVEKNNIQQNIWHQETERWRKECELLRSKPQSNQQLTDYYESQIRELLESKQIIQSEMSSLMAENSAICTRLEHLISEKNAMESILERSAEELRMTNDNYKNQLDAMTEHLATQNEKITKQCDEIQALKHSLTFKK